MKPDHDTSLRQHLLELLKGGSAHARFEDAIAGIPTKLRGMKPAGFPHSPWMLLEHLRIAQWDILEFSRNRKHVSPDWPEGYWPRSEAPPSAAAWNASVKRFRKDLKAMQDWWRIRRLTSMRAFPGETGRPSCARPCWWPITMPITWRRWWMCGGCWESGLRNKSRPRIRRSLGLWGSGTSGRSSKLCLAGASEIRLSLRCASARQFPPPSTQSRARGSAAKCRSRDARAAPAPPETTGAARSTVRVRGKYPKR